MNSTISTGSKTVLNDEEKMLLNTAYAIIAGICDRTQVKLTNEDIESLDSTRKMVVWKAAHIYARTRPYAEVEAGSAMAWLMDRRNDVLLGGVLGAGATRGVLNFFRQDCIKRLDAKRQQRTAPVQAAVAEAAPISTARVIANGTYTLVATDGTHTTLRLRDDFRDDAPEGAQVAQYLAGADNDNDYIGFAFITGTQVRVWNRYRTGYDAQRNALAALLADPAKAADYGYAYALESGNCYRCGRTLTVPASITRGLGPTCAQKADAGEM